MKITNIGPCVIKDCIIGVNEVYANEAVKVKSVEYIMVSANFVHPEQSYMMAIITYKVARGWF